MSTGYLSRLESGTRRPTSRVVAQLAQRLGVPISEFEAPADAEHRTARAQASSLAQILASVVSVADGDDLAENLAEALRGEDARDPALRWQALWLLARTRSGQGRWEEARELLTELIALSGDLDSDLLRARARTQLSRCVRLIGDNAQAREHALEASRIAANLPVADRAAALHALVSAETELGLLVEARAHTDELCEFTEQVGGTLLVEAQWAAATVRIRQGDHAGALPFLDRALVGLDSHENLILWLRLRLAAASLYLQVAPPLTDQARARLDEVAPLLNLVGTDMHKQQLLTLRAHVAFHDGDVDQARALCRQVDDARLLSFRDRIRFHALCGRLRILDGDRDSGIAQLQNLAQEAQAALNVDLAAEIWRALAETLADDRSGTRHATAPAKGRRPKRTAPDGSAVRRQVSG